jgi:hypothetical protein
MGPGANMKTLDLKTSYKKFYSQPNSRISIVEVPELAFLAVDGRGDPNTSPEYRAAIEALYAVAYGLKFSFKKRTKSPVDYPVMPLEGLWWVSDMRNFDVQKKHEWNWRMMIMQPPCVELPQVEEMKTDVSRKKSLPSVTKVELIRYHEGEAAQVLHLGPYADEAPTIQALHDFIDEEGYIREGLHHEIYLGDPRKTAPSRLKTILRQPVRRK